MLTRVSRDALLKVPLVLGLAAVTIAGLINLTRPSSRITAAVFLAIFAFILFSPVFWHGRKIMAHIGLAALSALTAGLMTLENGWGYFPILFFMMAPLAMFQLPAKTGLAWIGLFTLITGVIYFVMGGVLGLASLLPFAAGYIFFGIFGWMMVEAERNRKRSEQLLVELQAAHQQLQEYAARVEDLTIAQERNRIAREMHDTLGHRLTIASVQLEGAQRLIPTNPERAVSILATVRDQVKEGMVDLRRTVAMLRASVEEDLPLDKALTRLVDQVQQATALKIHLSLTGCPEHLSPPQRQALYRAAQEGLTNIQRHARASEAWLQLTVQEEMVQLLLSDNGVGVSPERAQSGYGLVGLKERAALQGGDFHVDARAGGGTQITMRFPYQIEPQSLLPVEACGETDE